MIQKGTNHVKDRPFSAGKLFLPLVIAEEVEFGRDTLVVHEQAAMSHSDQRLYGSNIGADNARVSSPISINFNRGSTLQNCFAIF